MAERQDVDTYIRPGILDIMDRSADVLNTYHANVKRKLILVDRAWIEKYPYKTTKLAGLYEPLHFGFHDRFMGGQVHKIAKVSGTPYMLLVNKVDDTVAIFIPDENLKDVTIPVLKELCDTFKKEYKSDTTKPELIRMLTE